jgi:XTP/dITP diphosphohydrolase
VATRSAGKQREVKRLLAESGLDLVFPGDLNLFEDPSEDLLERADSFRANALAKAEHFAKRSGLPTVADDSGLEVFYLGGAPGTLSKRWAGASGSAEEVDAANNTELMRRLAGAPEAKRMARYRCALVLFRKCAGRILEAPAGTAGFGYDPYFFSTDLGKSFGEATDAEKDAVSHRGKAFKALVTALKE